MYFVAKGNQSSVLTTAGRWRESEAILDLFDEIEANPGVAINRHPYLALKGYLAIRRAEWEEAIEPLQESAAWFAENWMHWSGQTLAWLGKALLETGQIEKVSRAE